MTEEVFHIHKYSAGHRIDRQLLLSLEDIFRQYNEKFVLEIIAECVNNTKYKFSSIDECFECFDKKPYRIVKMEIVVTFGEKYDSNKIIMTFDNRHCSATEIQFRFNTSDDYFLIKNKIESCLKNFRLWYRILSDTAIMPILLTIAFIVICVYTRNNNIIFPTGVQYLIIITWFGGSFICPQLMPFVIIKRNLFPCTEFRVGQNELIEAKNAQKRNFIVNTVVIGIIVAVAANCISSFLF